MWLGYTYIDLEWCPGFILGLWYVEFNDNPDFSHNLGIFLALGFFRLRLWLDPKPEAIEDDDDPPY